jgi:putative ABC transport system substrate-binding protein
MCKGFCKARETSGLADRATNARPGGHQLQDRAARNKVPAVYTLSEFARDGGLLSYGADRVDILRGADTYVDRILRAAKPADLPVQLPTKFEMAVNRKTANALGLAILPSIMLRADEVTLS